MASLRYIHRIMNERGHVVLADGRIAKIMRVDTSFPDNDTKITVWTVGARESPGPAKIECVDLVDVVGAAS